MNIADILSKECVAVGLPAADKTAVITALVDLLDRSGQLSDRDRTLKAILRRESTSSTGVGDGLAIPHGKSDGCRALSMAVARTAAPVDFGARDGRPCQLIVLLASPMDEVGPHIQALARISRLWLTPQFRDRVASAETAEQLFEAFARGA